MDTPRVNHFSYLGNEMVMTQFSLLAENLQKAFPDASNEGFKGISKQISNIRSSRERWPSKILKTYKDRIVPVFAAEDITKMNQSHMSRVEDVNDARKRIKETLRNDIGRKKKNSLTMSKQKGTKR